MNRIQLYYFKYYVDLSEDIYDLKNCLPYLERLRDKLYKSTKITRRYKRREKNLLSAFNHLTTKELKLCQHPQT